MTANATVGLSGAGVKLAMGVPRQLVSRRHIVDNFARKTNRTTLIEASPVRGHRRSSNSGRGLEPQRRTSENSTMSLITLRVNGRSHTLEADPTTPLLYVLSDDLA